MIRAALYFVILLAFPVVMQLLMIPVLLLADLICRIFDKKEG